MNCVDPRLCICFTHWFLLLRWSICGKTLINWVVIATTWFFRNMLIIILLNDAYIFVNWVEYVYSNFKEVKNRGRKRRVYIENKLLRRLLYLCLDIFVWKAQISLLLNNTGRSCSAMWIILLIKIKLIKDLAPKKPWFRFWFILPHAPSPTGILNIDEWPYVEYCTFECHLNEC